MKRTIAAILGAFALYSSPALAGKEIYACEINERLAVSETGRFRDATRGAVGASARGLKFIIVRETGRVQGDAPVGLGPDQAARVIQRGNEETFFIAMFLGKKSNSASLEAIWVEESFPSRRKPFVAVEAGFVYAGTCE